MAWIKSPIILASLSLALSLEVALHSGLSIQAQPAVAQSLPTTVDFKPPQDEGAPQGTDPGGTRGGCIKEPLVALIPGSYFGLTVSEHPTILFYMPAYESDSPMMAEFQLNGTKENKESDDILEEPVYKTTFEITGAPGIVSVPLPANLPALEVGKWYRWDLSVSVMCDSQQSGYQLVDGWIKRKEANPNLVRGLRRASPLERVALYAKEGIWHDSLAGLAQLRRSKPNDLEVTEAWKKLLKSLELEKRLNGDKRLNEDKLMKAPLTECCTLNN